MDTADGIEIQVAEGITTRVRAIEVRDGETWVLPVDPTDLTDLEDRDGEVYQDAAGWVYLGPAEP